MFGIVASGRFVQTNFQPIGYNQYMAAIENADKVNHITVFLTGSAPLPEQYTAMIYLGWQSTESLQQPGFQLLGGINMQKPSAIFKVSGLKKKEEPSNVQFFSQPAPQCNASVCICIEDNSTALDKINSITAMKQNDQAMFVEFTQNMLSNFFNYATSFARTQNNMEPNPTESYVPLSTLQNWYQNFERRIANNPYFWRN